MEYTSYLEVMESFDNITFSGTALDLIMWYNSLQPQWKEQMERYDPGLYDILEVLVNTYNEEAGKEIE